MAADSLRTYRLHEFATLTGVSVRALHHYDRLGLLTPRRTASGYRLDVDGDATVLEQIVALKFIGVPLRDGKRLLRTAPGDFKKVLAAQRTPLEEKRRRLDLAITAIRQAHDVNVEQPAAWQRRSRHVRRRGDEGRRYHEGRPHGSIRSAFFASPPLAGDPLGKLLLAGLAIPFLEGPAGNLAFHEKLRELSPLRLALERHPDIVSGVQPNRQPGRTKSR